MSNEITVPGQNSPRIDLIERFQSLQSGQYWRSLVAIPEQGIAADETLLIKNIRYVENKIHTIALLPHPSHVGRQFSLIKERNGEPVESRGSYGDHEFLLQDFLNLFEFEPNHQVIREREIARIQSDVQAIQREMIEVQSNPVLMGEIVQLELAKKHKNNPESNNLPVIAAPMVSVDPEAMTLGSLMSTGLTAQSIEQFREQAENQVEIATIKAKWIQAKTEEISQTLGRMTPYFKEQAEAALAQTQEVRDHVKKIVSGIETLDLYVGTDVSVQTIATGASAPQSEPLVLMQKKLVMDEEFCLWADVDESFDFQSKNRFFDELVKNTSLLEQVMPFPRSIAVMATTRRFIDYGSGGLTNSILNANNQAVFLLVRDGQNIHQVYSPVTSHLRADRLFPSKSDQEGIFRGVDGHTIRIDEIEYSRRHEQHELFALHYKRFLILLCGLDHRLKLMGDFYEGSAGFDFISMDFQEKNFRFIHDDDGSSMMPGIKLKPLDAFIQEQNEYMRPGSRVLCQWDKFANQERAPGMFRYSDYQRGYEQRFSPENEVEITTVKGSDHDLHLMCSVNGSGRNGLRKFNTKVDISGRPDGLLCLDAVTADDLEPYVTVRSARVNFLVHVRMFKYAIRFLRQEEDVQAPARAALIKALADGRIAEGDTAHEFVSAAIRSWRADNDGALIPQPYEKEFDQLLDHLFFLARSNDTQTALIEQFVLNLGYRPLRLVVPSKGGLVVYAEPKMEERDDRLSPHVWAHRIVVAIGKRGGVNEKSRKWAVLPQFMAAETTLHQWAEADEWAGKRSAFGSFKDKQDIFDKATPNIEQMRLLSGDMNKEAWSLEADNFILARYAFNEGKSSVSSVYRVFPIGVYLSSDGHVSVIVVACAHFDSFLHQKAPSQECRSVFEQRYGSIYANKLKVTRRLIEHSSEFHPGSSWYLYTMPASKIGGIHLGFGTGEGGTCLYWASGNNSNDLSTVSERINKWINNGKRASSIWLTPSIHDSNGKLIVDEILGSKLPDDYEPTMAYRITIGSGKEKIARFVDVVPKALFDQDHVSGKGYFSRASDLIVGVDHRSMGGSGTDFNTVEAALKHARRNALPSGEQSALLAKYPPMEGVIERIFCYLGDDGE